MLRKKGFPNRQLGLIGFMVTPTSHISLAMNSTPGVGNLETSCNLPCNLPSRKLSRLLRSPVIPENNNTYRSRTEPIRLQVGLQAFRSTGWAFQPS